MAEKHPAFWKVEALRARRGEAQARAELAALVAQNTAAERHAREIEFNALLTALALDPKGTYLLDDAAETIVLAPAPGNPQCLNPKPTRS